MIGLEETFYQVTENNGVVEVCAIVHSPVGICPIAFPFDVKLRTTNGSAGKYRVKNYGSMPLNGYHLIKIFSVSHGLHSCIHLLGI